MERICKRVNEPKKHIIRLLVKNFGAALAEGALTETIAIEKRGWGHIPLAFNSPRSLIGRASFANQAH